MQVNEDTFERQSPLAPLNCVVARSMKDFFEHSNGTNEQLQKSLPLIDVLEGNSHVKCSPGPNSACATAPDRNFAVCEFASTMLSNSSANSTVDSSRKGNLNVGNATETNHESGLSFSALNSLNNEPRDKIWFLNESAHREEVSGAPYGSMNQSISFPDPSLVAKPLAKRAITGASANYGATSHGLTSPVGVSSGTRNQLAMSSSNPFYGANGSKSHSNLNWPLMSQVPTSFQSPLTWSNSYNSSLASVPQMNSTSHTAVSNALPSAWSNNVYGGASHQKRPPMCNQGNLSFASKKSVYPSESQSIMAGHSATSPSKYRRTPAMSNFKNYPTNLTGPSSMYELGSTGSDNTSSSSDSANLRENGLLQLQDRNVASHSSPLDTLRYSLEPQLFEIMRNNSTPDNKGFNYNMPYQNMSPEDKKHLKNRNLPRRRGKSPFFTGNETDNLLADLTSQTGTDHTERYSRKVFVGGLPPDIDEEEITASFRRFGPLVVDWPHKAESKSYFPPKGYAFLLFQDETSVQMLIDACIQEEDKLYLCVSSPTIKDKPVQIRPWRLSDADYVLDASMPLDPRKTVFVGGVPRPLKAVELAMIMDRLYGGVCYAGIDTDPELKYPKGAGRVAFSNQQSYIGAISARFVQLQHADIEKRVEVKPYVLDDQTCDECGGSKCGGKFAPYFCANITCLQYYCENCWANIHSRPGREFHKPLVKEGADRPRAVPFRWC